MHAWQSCFAMTSHCRLIVLFIYFYLMTCQGIWHPFFQVFCFPSKLHEEEKSKITINLCVSFLGKAPVTCDARVVSRLFILIFKQGRAVWHLFSLQHLARRKQNWQSTCSWKDVPPVFFLISQHAQYVTLPRLPQHISQEVATSPAHQCPGCWDCHHFCVQFPDCQLLFYFTFSHISFPGKMPPANVPVMLGGLKVVFWFFKREGQFGTTFLWQLFCKGKINNGRMQYVLADKTKQSTSASTAPGGTSTRAWWVHLIHRLLFFPKGAQGLCVTFLLVLVVDFSTTKNTNNNSPVCLIGPSRLIVLYYYPGMPSRVLGTIFFNFVLFKAIGGKITINLCMMEHSVDSFFLQHKVGCWGCNTLILYLFYTASGYLTP